MGGNIIQTTSATDQELVWRFLRVRSTSDCQNTVQLEIMATVTNIFYTTAINLAAQHKKVSF